MSNQKGLQLIKTISEYISKTNGFDGVLKKVQLVSGGNGACTAEFKVSTEHLNSGGGLHGGFIATLVDAVSTYALMTDDKSQLRPGVSVNISVNYMKGAREGDDVVVNAKTLRVGKSLAFLEVELKDKLTNSILAQGSHTKYILTKLS